MGIVQILIECNWTWEGRGNKVCGLWFNNLSGDKYLAFLFDGACVKVATGFSFKK